ncbi:cysteine desulfurase family protein [Nakamurella lactea]|uniref:cysteine desulfurase family protein n=1 Tax=Nakamurella lactea TaxID=459515 RepID=UPI000410B9B9|nr:cysteine desulfurase family protein [Nakamurella lactea]
MVYLDHAATTPVLPAVVEAVAEAMAVGGNPSSVHSAGRAARSRIEEARELLAALLDAHPSEVLFTSGGTESDNLAVTGLFQARHRADPARREILLSGAEHHAVLDAADHLAATGAARIRRLPVDRNGRVTRDAFADAAAERPDRIALASVMWANNETGAVSDIAALSAIAGAAGFPLHTDAVQAVGTLDVDFARSSAAALSIAGHKLGGPGGTGLLLLRRDAALVPLQHGGGQERGLRSGTLNVAGAVGLAVAVEEAVTRRAVRAAEYARLGRRLIDGVRAIVPDAELTGSDPADQAQLPGVVHLRFPGCESETLLMLLDAAGVECSAGSACTAGVTRASHVLLAIGLDEPAARSSLRFSLGHTSSDADIDAVTAVIGEVVRRAKDANAKRTNARAQHVSPLLTGSPR